MDRAAVWHAKLERRRQPALHYISSHEDSEGPHLICDWNGAPATFARSNVDILSELKITRDATRTQQQTTSIPCTTDVFQPVASRQVAAFSLLSQDDGSHIDFLTVPPVPPALINKQQTKKAKLPPDNSSNNQADDSEVASSASSSTSAPTSASSNGTSQAPAKRKKTKAPPDKRMSRKLRTRISQQFYRMAANAGQSVQAEQQLPTPPYHQPGSVIVSPPGYTGMVPYSLSGPTIAAHQMMSNGFDLAPHTQNTPPNVQVAGSKEQKLANTQQLISNRHQTTPTNNHTQSTISSNNNNNKPLAENPLLAMDPQTPACSLSEINLFNALGLSNLTNNQLVLSLQQQQSLLQASAAALPQSLTASAQDAFCLLNDTYNHQQSPTSFWQVSSSKRPVNANPRARANADEIQQSPHLQHHFNTDPSEEGKEMLKFSINTILGSGSARPPSLDRPQQSPAAGCQDTSHMKLYDQQLADSKSRSSCNMSINHHQEMKSKINREMVHQQAESRSINCDHSQSDSDDCSGSLNQSPTPEAGSSILFPNNDDSDHPSANTQQHMNDFMADHHQHQHHHQQQASLHNQNHIQHPFLGGSSVFPWAVASRGKPRRGMMRRAVFSDGQRVGLEKRFQLQKYISKPDRKKLAEKLGLRDSQVKIWFQNRRMKWRNSKERELLSAGGSREQTLPTRSNPNPDLSDVGETIKRLTGAGGTTVES